MSSLTSKEVRGLMEAYQQVYAPQEIAEEQVWEEVENWVNSLVEEGYDLSEYTWEEIYETYWTSNQSGPVTMYNRPRANTGQSYQSPYARPRRDKLNSLNTGGRRPEISNINPNEGTGKGAPGSGIPLDPGRFEREKARLKRVGNPPEKLSQQPPTTQTQRPPTGGSGGSAGTPAAGSTKPAGTPARASSPANASTADKIKGGMEVYNKQKQSGDVKGAAQTGMDVNKLKYGDNFAKPKTPNPLMKGMPGQNKAELDQIRGNAALSSISQSPSANRILSGTSRSPSANEIGASSLKRSAASISAKPAPTPAAKPAPAKPAPAASAVPANTFTGAAGNAAASAAKIAAKPAPTTPPKKPETQLFHTDLFDLVKGYLLDEGYADTEEAALAIMSSMSEEWRESIVEQQKSPEYYADRAAHYKREYGIDLNKPTPRPMGRQAAQRRIEQQKSERAKPAPAVKTNSTQRIPEYGYPKQPKSPEFYADREKHYRLMGLR